MPHLLALRCCCSCLSLAKLVKLMNEGSLDAISAVEGLVNGSEVACSQAVRSGAIAILAGFINIDDGDGQVNANSDNDSGLDEERMRRNEERRKQLSKHKAAPALTGVHELAALTDGRLEQAFVQLGVGADERPNAEGARKKFVPVASKSEVVAALRHIATSNDSNREVITREKVIPALVKLMTKMQAQEDGKSGGSGMSGDKKSEQSHESGTSGGSGSNSTGKKSKKQLMAEALDRKKLAEDNRRLAESAGNMLHQLILEGSGRVKQIIISAIIATVQQPGSKPPEDVPALMTILRSAAEEQLSLVQSVDNFAALQSALDFGRWIKVPPIMLGMARNNFLAAQEERKRKLKAGLDASTSEDQAEEAEGSATTRKTKKRSSRKKKPIARELTGAELEAAKREEQRKQAAEAAARAAEVVEQAAEAARTKLNAIRAGLAQKSDEYSRAQAERQRLVAPPPPDNSGLLDRVRVDAERHFMAQELYMERMRRRQQQIDAMRQVIETSGGGAAGGGGRLTRSRTVAARSQAQQPNSTAKSPVRQRPSVAARTPRTQASFATRSPVQAQSSPAVRLFPWERLGTS